MTVNFAIDLFENPNHLLLELSENAKSKAWEQSQGFSSDRRCWNAYLNRLCVNAVLPYLQEEEPRAKLWHERELDSFWEVVNGTAITWGQKRLILIPSDAYDLDELRVPQEWLDIPSWVGDYYLAAQVDPEKGWVRLWGYATHKKLKERGRYTSRDRTYFLTQDELIGDLNVLWVALERCPNEVTRSAVAPLPALTPAHADNLLVRLGKPELVFPRRAVPFELWGALLEGDSWRRRLYELRSPEIDGPVVAAIANLGQEIANLSQWLQDIFEAGWQSIEQLARGDDNLAWRMVAAARTRSADLRGDRQETEQPVAQIRGGKILEQLGTPSSLLLVDLEELADGRRDILIQVHPMGTEPYLPKGLQLVVLDESGKTFMEAQAGERDNWIQLNFRAQPEEKFKVQVVLGDNSFIQEFVA
jgi:hypothetical protein